MYRTIIRIKIQPKTQIVEEFLYSSWLCTPNSIIDIRIAMSGAITIKPICHWYLDADAKTINFFLFRLRLDSCEYDFFRDLDDDLGSCVGAGDVGETLCCVLLLPLLSCISV